ncbi:MAG: cytochrome c [Bryobacteraceae bacterium]
MGDLPGPDVTGAVAIMKEMLEGTAKHVTLAVAIVFWLSAFGLTVQASAGPKAAQLPDGPGKETVQKICSGCHAPEIVLGHRDTKDGWEAIVSSMVDKGANGTDDEFNTIIDYLAAHFPKNSDSKSGAR